MAREFNEVSISSDVRRTTPPPNASAKCQVRAPKLENTHFQIIRTRGDVRFKLSVVRTGYEEGRRYEKS
ncbi:hypothetical protein HOLleu_13911 [Holothuria leucospilota]|uniref:Uncharacterized protein n=1 Tax=Holothuria leucospilota TaxID=206669 RepID=A0A9Q1C5S1_HOLLE|nr:hypothetical protein HOLleu_13911 [Holothuria leucospilota]